MQDTQFDATAYAVKRFTPYLGVENAEQIINALPAAYQGILAEDMMREQTLVYYRLALAQDCIQAHAEFMKNPTAFNWIEVQAYNLCYQHLMKNVRAT